ncbi:MAG: 30S ribosomal protein S14 [Candidatus Aenigmarchaeota archaeon]|nr:30S ribosomal protein S14 [Candidatus Aenigmarchaeota archaeon]
MKHNVPKDRKNGLGNAVCRRCGKKGMGVISKYGLNYCRRCFREQAKSLGFKKYS